MAVGSNHIGSNDYMAGVAVWGEIHAGRRTNAGRTVVHACINCRSGGLERCARSAGVRLKHWRGVGHVGLR